MTFQNIMSVNVPVYHFQTRSDDAGEIYPYGFAATSGELDGAVEALSGVFQDMLKLAEIEKTSQLLAEEIEKTRRRVNALEYVKIPQMEEAIQYITMKLDENGAVQHHPPDESQGYAAQGSHRGKAGGRRQSRGGVRRPAGSRGIVRLRPVRLPSVEQNRANGPVANRAKDLSFREKWPPTGRPFFRGDPSQFAVKTDRHASVPAGSQ